jgi:hypothetical protein
MFMMYVLLLDQELSEAHISTLLGYLFGIDPHEVGTILAEEPRQVNFDTRSLQRTLSPRQGAELTVFFFELCIFPHGIQMQGKYENEQAFARAFSTESQLPILLNNERSPYSWLLVEAGVNYEVMECPEDEEVVAITVTAENKVRLPSH